MWIVRTQRHGCWARWVAPTRAVRIFRFHPTASGLCGPQRKSFGSPAWTGNSRPELASVRGAAEQPKWSPDGKHIAFVSQREGHSLVSIYDFDGDFIRYL